MRAGTVAPEEPCADHEGREKAIAPRVRQERHAHGVDVEEREGPQREHAREIVAVPRPDARGERGRTERDRGNDGHPLAHVEMQHRLHLPRLKQERDRKADGGDEQAAARPEEDDELRDEDRHPSRDVRRSRAAVPEKVGGGPDPRAEREVRAVGEQEG
jgi:hypothetical protein